MNSIELFSGAGGLAKGLELAGAEHCVFVEWNADACNTLRLNFESDKVFEGDVRNFKFSDYSDVDIIAGGPPCQPFSIGGKAQGYEDQRDMFPAAISAIRALRPKAFIFENVKGLLRPSFAEYFNFILLQLQYPDIELASNNWRENLNTLISSTKDKSKHPIYKVTYQLVNAADYGVPQIRERVIIVGFRSDLSIHWTFPRPTHSKDALLWSMFVTGDYWRKHGIRNYFPKEVSDTRMSVLLQKYGMFQPTMKPWNTVRDAIGDLGEPNNQGDHILRKGAKEYHGHTGSCIDEPSKTIKAGGHGVPGGENMVKFPDGHVRYYSVAEAKRIQTFPDEYKVTGSWTEAMRQLGNAVPVKLANRIAESVITSLNGSYIRLNSATLGL